MTKNIRITANFRSSPTSRGSNPLQEKIFENILTKDLFIDILSFSSFLLLNKHKNNF